MPGVQPFREPDDEHNRTAASASPLFEPLGAIRLADALDFPMSRPLDVLAREHAAKAIETVTDIMNDWSAEDKDRLKAADMILDRGHGKPVNATIALPNSNAHRKLLAMLSDEQLMAQIEAAPLPRLAQDVEFEDVDPLCQ